MTATTAAPESLDAQFDALRRRFPHVRGSYMIALHTVMMQPDVTLEDARARAAMFGSQVSAAELAAARRLLQLQPQTANAPVVGRSPAAVPPSRLRSDPPPTAKPTRTAPEKQVPTTVASTSQNVAPGPIHHAHQPADRGNTRDRSCVRAVIRTSPIAGLNNRIGLKVTFDVHGAQVECFASEAAVEQWCAANGCEITDVQRLHHVAQEVVVAAMSRDMVSAGERWIAQVAKGSVALMVADEDVSQDRCRGALPLAGGSGSAEHPSMTPNQKTRGRKPDATSKSGQIRSLLATGASASDIAKRLGCKPALVYNVKARMGGAAPKRGPGRPPKATKAVPTTSLNGIEGIIAAVKNAERQQAQLRGVLVQIQQIVAAAMN